MLLWVRGVISCRKKPNKFFSFVFPVEFQLYFTGFLKVYICNSSFIDELFNIKNWKSSFFYNFMNPLILERKFSQPEMALSVTCINFWKFHDDLKACLEVIRLPSWLENVKFSVENQIFTFLTPWKICFWINDKFEMQFFWKWTWNVHMPPKPIFLFKFSNF